MAELSPNTVHIYKNIYSINIESINVVFNFFFQLTASCFVL